MNPAQGSLFGGQRLRMEQAIELTADSLNTYGPRYEHWALAWSGGKDSTTTLTLVLHLMDAGLIPRPKTFTVLYSDTRMEIHPLWLAAQDILVQLRQRGVDVRVVMAPMDKRFLVYILGRGVPPPNNNTLRWCTRQIKVDPMVAELTRLHGERGGKVLMITGVRQGESAIRDGRIAQSCSKDGAECGQGWFQETLPEALCDTLAPLLHWRVCHVWDWLNFFAPSAEHGGWSTRLLAEAYGGEEAEEINARTGCICCPLAERDTALDALIRMPAWGYLAPLKHLREVYRELRLPANRLRKAGAEVLKSGELAKNPQRMGPITLEARRQALERVLAIQGAVNHEAARLRRPEVDILNPEERSRIEELIAAGTWPEGWTGDEPLATELLDKVYQDGSVQPLLAMFDRP